MTESDVSLLYLYGIVESAAPDPPETLRGVDDSALELIRSGAVAAVVGAVDPEAYADETLEARMKELEWVGSRALAHERVLDWFLERGPVVPMSPFSLHEGHERLRARLLQIEPRTAELLERLRGRREWGVKLWRNQEALRQHLDELSPAVRAVSKELEAAAAGRRYLLLKKKDALEAEELRTLGRRVAHQLYERLATLAERATVVPTPPAPPERERALALQAAFLLEDERMPAFQEALGLALREYGAVGFEIELTGPWPPYHFSDPDDG